MSLSMYRTCRILYVDDDPGDLHTFKGFFRRQYEIFTASSEEEGLEILEKSDVHIIISGRTVPQMTGFDFLSKAALVCPEAVKIVLTRNDDIDTLIEEVKKHDVFQYLVKPQSKNKMELTLNTAFELYLLREENRRLTAELQASNTDFEKQLEVKVQAITEENERLEEETGKHIRAKKELKRAKDKAEETAQAGEQFLSTMSHEIRTPLNAVIGAVHLLRKENLTPNQEDSIRILEFAAQHLLGIINNLLDLSKIESGAVNFEKLPFNLNEQIKKVFQSFKPEAARKALNLTLNLPADEYPELIGDPLRLNQVLSNLLSNAIKFTNKGSVELALRKVRENNEEIHFRFLIRDTGIGISKESLNGIFEHFSQAGSDISRKYGGTGLGLAICKRLVEQQGGEIRVESKVGFGSSFYFYLSFQKNNAPEKNNSEIRATDIKGGLEGVSILLVEDNKVNQKIAKKFIAYWGAEILVAENGKVALDIFHDNDFDIILMDMHMPVMNGYEASSAIRKLSDSVKSKVPIIALSASMLNKRKKDLVAFGIDDYVMKPFDPGNLYETIVRHTTAVRRAVPVKKEGFKSTHFRKLADGNGQVLQELTQITVTDLNNFRQHLNEFFEDRDFDRFHPKLDKIKPLFSLLEISDLKESIDHLQKIILNGQEDEAQGFYTGIDRQIEHIINELREFCG